MAAGSPWYDGRTVPDPCTMEQGIYVCESICIKCNIPVHIYIRSRYLCSHMARTIEKET